MAWTINTSGSAIAKAGINANATIITSGSYLYELSEEAEGYVCSLVRYDVVANWASLTSSGKKIFQKLTTAMIAQGIMGYDLSGWDLREAETMLDFLENNINDARKLLEDDKTRKYLGVQSGS